MARKAPPSYAAVELPTETPAAPEPVAIAATPQPAARRGRSATGRTLKDTSAQVMIYLNPPALKALKRYALDENTKVHSLLIEAVEGWFKTHGLQEQVRVQRDTKAD